jgi:hypothetical protein
MGVRDARRLGLVEAARRSTITNRQTTVAPGISARQFHPLKKRVAVRGDGVATRQARATVVATTGRAGAVTGGSTTRAHGGAPEWQPHRAHMLACRYSRTVTCDNVVTLPGGCILHLPPGPHRRSRSSRKVEVRELLDGRLIMRNGANILLEQPAPAEPFTLMPRSSRAERCLPRRNAAPQAARFDNDREPDS